MSTPNVGAAAATRVALGARWDGTAWTATATAAPPSGGLIGGAYLGVSCVTGSGCTVVGSEATAQFGSTFRTRAVTWDGSGWTGRATPEILGAVENELVAVSCATEQFCAAVGSRTSADGTGQPVVERWDGDRWRADAPSQPDGSSLTAVSCATARDCLAVGSSAGPGGTLRPLTEHWDGATWRAGAAPVPAAATSAAFIGVSCPSRGICTAVGLTYDATGTGRPLSERRTGASWQVQAVAGPPGGSTSGYLTGVSCATPNACTAVGAFSTATGTFPPSGPPGPCDFSCPLSEHWTSGGWQADASPSG